MRAEEWVLISVIVFFALLWRMGVPGKVLAMLDSRGEAIKAQLSEAKQARDEAAALLASFEKKRAAAEEEAKAIVARAEEDAKRAVAAAEVEIERAMARRLKTAEDRISQAEAAAQREVRSAAAQAAIDAAGRVMAARMTDADADAALADGLKEVAKRLN